MLPILANENNCHFQLFAAVYAVTLNICLWQILSVTSINHKNILHANRHSAIIFMHTAEAELYLILIFGRGLMLG